MDIEAAAQVVRDEFHDDKHCILSDDECRDVARSIIAAAFPWRPVSEAIPRNVVVQARALDQPSSVVMLVVANGDTARSAIAGPARMGIEQRGRPVPLADLIEAGAEYRELLP
jgi:hypothetical protein